MTQYDTNKVNIAESAQKQILKCPQCRHYTVEKRPLLVHRSQSHAEQGEFPGAIELEARE